MTGLEAAYQAEMLSSIDECKTLRPRYNPTAWAQMIARWGAHQVALRLVVSGEFQSGFLRLIAAGRPDLTVEWSILQPRWDPLFADHPKEREAARWRLETAGVDLSALEGAL